MTDFLRGSTTCVVCRVGERLCAFPLERVAEVAPPLPVSPLARLPDFVSGLAVVRGAAIPVVDAAALFHPEARTGRTPAARFVILGVGARRIALAVDAVIGIRPWPRQPVGELPPLLGEACDEAVDGIGTSDQELLFVLSAARLLGRQDWQTIEEGGAR